MKYFSVFQSLYKTFIPEPPKPVKIQAENALYFQSPDSTNTEKHQRRKNHRFNWSKLVIFTKSSNDKKNGEYPTECYDDDESSHIIERTCSFETLYDYLDKTSDIEVRENNEVESHVDEEKVILGMYEKDYVPIVDKFIQKCVEITGSVYIFIIVWMLIIVWIVIGIVYNAPDNWQIVMQDGQSIQTYVWDIFLMRQQLDDTQKFLTVYGKLRSRAALLKKLLYQIKTGENNGREILFDINLPDVEEQEKKCIEISKSQLTWFERLSNFSAQILGSLPAIIIYWIGVFIWIGCGSLNLPTGNEPPYTGETTGSNPQYGKFTNEWQMYINTAVALELVITSVFLENIRLRSNELTRNRFNEFIDFDSKLELELREMTQYSGDNLPVVVCPVPRHGLKKYISFYAGVVGNGLGLVISSAVFIAWIGIGTVMKWNSNWWLIIGTYTGLVGFIDGFTLREVYLDITDYEESLFDIVAQESQALLDLVGFEYDLKEASNVHKQGFLSRLSLKISEKINYVCSRPWSVVFSIVVVVGLVALGCGLRWSQMAQLIANTPTMIIEGFFLLILIQAHDWADHKRTRLIEELIQSRKMIFQYLDNVKYEATHETQTAIATSTES